MQPPGPPPPGWQTGRAALRLHTAEVEIARLEQVRGLARGENQGSLEESHLPMNNLFGFGNFRKNLNKFRK